MKNREVVEYNKGKENKFAFVFSCPGQLEQSHNKLVFGKTGENLEILLRYLKPEKFIKENFNDRYDFRITNSSNKVHYKKWNNRTEPLISEIKKEENINRLIEELKDITDTIICFGRKAEVALKQIEKDIKVKPLYTNHLGSRGLNAFVKKRELKITTKGNERTKEILEQVAQELKDKYNKIK